MSEKKIDVGIVVRLKSGGPWLTVARINTYRRPDGQEVVLDECSEEEQATLEPWLVRCAWMLADGRPAGDDFYAYMLDVRQ